MSQKITAYKLVKLGFTECITDWVDYPGQHLIFYTLELPDGKLTLYTEYHAWTENGYWVKCYEREEIHITEMYVLRDFLKRHS